MLTSPKAMDVTITQRYVCQIHSQRHINVRALENGYLNEIMVREGQAVKKGDLMFKIVPDLNKAKLDAESAEAKLAQLELQNTKKLFDNKKHVSENEVQLFEARTGTRPRPRRSWRRPNWTLPTSEHLSTASSTACTSRSGSLVKEGDILTTLSDNSVMWVYFNVPEATIPRIHGQPEAA